MKSIGKIFPIVVFFVISLIIVFPLFPPGFILTMDQVVAGKIAFPTLISSPLYLFSLLLWVLNLFIPVDVLQKVMLFLIFFLSCYSMYRLLPKRLGMFRSWGGIFYAINPFVYERVMAGHWPFLLTYGIFPFLVSQVVSFYDHPTPKEAVKLGILSSIIMNLFIHFSLIFTAFLLIYGVIYFILQRNYLKRIIKPFIFFIVTTFLFNANWIIPLILGGSVLNNILYEFGAADIIAFQSVADNLFGLPFNLAAGYGFWPEIYQYFILPKNLIFFWPLLSLVFIGVSLWGAFKILKEKDLSTYPLLIALIALFLLALDFAAGVGLASIASIIFYLYEQFPVLRGLREPQKLVAIIMFCYAYFGSFGGYFLAGQLTKAKKYLVIAIIFVLPFVYTPTVFGGFWGQFVPTFYPASWYKVNDILKADKDDFIVLFFPWQQYIKPKFNRFQIMANPSSYFFSKTTISSLNYDSLPLYTHDNRFEALHVEGLLNIEKDGKNLLGDTVYVRPSWGKALAPINVKYIILAKEDDYWDYRFLNAQDDLKKILEDGQITLYQNLSWGKEEVIDEKSNPDLDEWDYRNLD